MAFWRRLKAAQQEKLGRRYFKSRTGDRAANLERAIACYSQALRFCTAEAQDS